jgi:regulatory protein
MATITDLRSSGPARRRRIIVVDGEPWRELPSQLAAMLGLEVGDEVDLDDLGDRVCAAEPRMARERAIRLLTARERSRSGLTSRLVEDGFSSEVARATVDDLVRIGLVDDERFAHALARTLANARSAGRARIARELRDAGIEESVADAALEEALPADHEIAAARRLAATSAARPGATVEKLAARLVRRGYRPALALEEARRAIGDADVVVDPDCLQDDPGIG